MDKGLKKWIWVGVIIAIVLLLTWWIVWEKEEPFQDPFLSVYKGEVLVDPVGKRLTGIWQWEGTNRSVERLESIYFHLYPRQFNPEQKLRGDNWDYILGEDRQPGQYDVNFVKVNGQTVDYKIEGILLQLMDLNWQQGTSLEVDIGFSLKLPKNEGRISYDEHALWLGNWIPTLAVYGESGWITDQYYPIGDPFFSSIADYQVEISLPVGYHLISSGPDETAARRVGGNWMQYKIQGERLRDFAVVVIDPHYTRLQDKVGDITVNTWFLEGDNIRAATQLHQTAVQAMHYYQETFGIYPYDEYDVVRTGGFFGGMEYPGLIFIQGSYFEDPEDKYGMVVAAHETAHQWWYAVVGNDQITEPWLDESVSEFSAMKFLMGVISDFGQLYVGGKVQFVSNPPEALVQQSEDIRKPVWEYGNWELYSYNVYNRGAVALWKLQEQVGRDKMDHFLKEYYRANQMSEVTGQDFQNAMIRHLGKESWVFFEEQIR